MTLEITVSIGLMIAAVWSMKRREDTVDFLRRLAFVMGLMILMEVILEAIK